MFKLLLLYEKYYIKYYINIYYNYISARVFFFIRKEGKKFSEQKQNKKRKINGIQWTGGKK